MTSCASGILYFLTCSLNSCFAALFATLTEQQATDVELNFALVVVEDDVATVNNSLTIVEGRVENHETRLTSLEETITVLDGRLGRLELSGIFKLNQEIRHKIV